jgi:polyisoprenoid-binding protein YceI
MQRSRGTARPATGGATPSLTQGAWRLDPDRSTIGFEAPHYWGLGTVRGKFTRYAGTLELGARPAIELTIDAGSLQTGNSRRDRHLRSADFFMVDRHPYVRFVSDSARLVGDMLRVRGQLLARGAELEVEVDAAVAPNAAGDEYELSASTFVMHRWLGMTWNPLGITRPYSRLIVSGALMPAPLEAGAAAARRPAFSRRGPAPATSKRCPR